MRIDVFTIFPGSRRGLCRRIDSWPGPSRRPPRSPHATTSATAHDDVHRSVDDSPFGGGAGMVLAAEPVFEVVDRVEASPEGLPRPLVLLSPSGRRFDQSVAAELVGCTEGFSLLCGRYEGVDQRVADHLTDDEISVGDFVLAGGELAALVGGRGGGSPSPRRARERTVRRRGELYHRSARVSPVHAAGHLPGLGGARGLAVGRPRDGGRVASGPGAGHHPPSASRPDRGPRRADRRRRSSSWPSTVKCRSFGSTATIGEFHRRRGARPLATCRAVPHSVAGPRGRHRAVTGTFHDEPEPSLHEPDRHHRS